MRQIKLVSLAILFLASVTLAQDKLLTIDDIFSTDAKVRVNFSGTPARLVWAGDGRSFRTVRNGTLMRVNAVSGDAVPYFDSSKYKTALVAAGVSEPEALVRSNSLGTQFN